MSDKQSYYYMKLKENFFETTEMRVLEGMPDGYLYSNILLKLYLASLHYDGKLMLNDMIPLDVNMIVSITGHCTAVVEKSLSIFKSLRLIDVLDGNTIYMSNIQHFVGKSSTEAERVRRYREKMKESDCCPALTDGQNSVQNVYKCTDDVQSSVQEVYKCTTKVHQRLEYRDKSIDNNTSSDDDEHVVEGNGCPSREVTTAKTSVKEQRKSNSAGYSDEFLRFYKVYPRKVGKVPASKSFERAVADGASADAIINDVLKRLNRGEWTDLKYVPHPATYLNQRRWEDDVDGSVVSYRGKPIDEGTNEEVENY